MKLAIILTAAAGLTAAVPDTHVVHERRELSSSRWIKRDRVPGDVLLPVRIGLAQTNIDKAHGYLMELSDPSSKSYGRTWTAEEVTEAFKPTDETVDAIKQWLSIEGSVTTPKLPAQSLVSYNIQQNRRCDPFGKQGLDCLQRSRFLGGEAAARRIL